MAGELSRPECCAKAVSTAELLPSDQLYEDALDRLNRLRTNFEARREAIQSDDRAVLLQQMIQWCEETGYARTDFDTLNAIHIAGSKGKGSTAAFVFSILSQYLGHDHLNEGDTSLSLRKIGLYTSPHLRSTRERIRIRESRTTDLADTALDKSKFARYFSDTWDRLGLESRPPLQSPPFARFLTLMGLHTFIQERVDTAIVEACLGGRYDSTNILHQPNVCAITKLELEHTDILGSTIGEIAWAKGGIIKSGVPVFTVPQLPEAMLVLADIARKENTHLCVVREHPDISNMRLGLAGAFQRMNASLAVAVAAAHLSRLGFKGIPEVEELMRSSLPEKFRQGLENAQWPGRCEVRDHGRIRWLLDAAHTVESLEALGPWAAGQFAAQSQAQRILIFNAPAKDGAMLLQCLRSLWNAMSSSWLSHEAPVFHRAIFCTGIPWIRQEVPDMERISVTYYGRSAEDLNLQHDMARCWREISRGECEVTVLRTVEEAIQLASAGNMEICEQIRATVLIAGSVHLVGSAIEVLEAVKTDE